MKMKLHW